MPYEKRPNLRSGAASFSSSVCECATVIVKEKSEAPSSPRESASLLVDTEQELDIKLLFRLASQTKVFTVFTLWFKKANISFLGFGPSENIPSSNAFGKATNHCFL